MDSENLTAVFRELERNGVEYAVFGAVALGLHGLARATADLDLFIAPRTANIERLKTALRSVYKDDSIDEISAEDLCGEYPAVRYSPPSGFSMDILTRLGEAFRYEDLDCESVAFGALDIRVVTPRMLWRLKKDTIRPIDQIDARALAERFGFEEG